MIDRGEVRADTRVAALLPVAGPLGDVTLSQLATHTSGLPTQLPTPEQVGRNYLGRPDRRQTVRRLVVAAAGRPR